MDKYERRRLRLIKLRDTRCHGSAAELARKIDRDPSYVTRMLYPEGKAGKKRIADDMIEVIETAFGLQRGWLDQEDDGFAITNTRPGPAVRGSVPLISWVQAGDYAEAIDNLAPGQGERIETTIQVKSHTYALRVTGDSMEPEFPEGCIIIVEPDMEPRHGDYTIVKNGNGEATFKQLIQDGSDWYLKPINPRYPVKPLPKGAVFCGVVRGMERRFR